MKTVFKNGTLLLPNHSFATGHVVVEGDRLAAILTKGEPVPAADRVLDCTDHLVMPGLINAHGHTPMTLVRGLGGGLPLQRWLDEAIFPVEARMTPADIAAGMTWGAIEMAAGGTTTVADMYDFPQAGGAALAAFGLRAHFCRVGLAFAPDVPPNRLKECVDYAAATVPEEKGLITHDFCLHSEYLTNEAFCRGLAEANRSLKRRVHVHVSETESEHKASLERHGKTPMAYLASLGVFDYGGYVAHGVWCTDDDFRLMKDLDVALVHNPTSNMKLGSGFARVARALELGVTVALGTDGCASNDNLDLFEEMHLAALLAKGVSRDPTALSAWEVIDMATANGARALGRTDIGRLAVGGCADLCVVDLRRPHLTPALDLANLIVYSMHASDVVWTMGGGRLVYDQGAFPTIDFAAAKAEFEAAVKRIGL